MHRVAEVVSRARHGHDVSDESRILESALQTWSIDSIHATDSYSEAMAQIAQSYKLCGLLVLSAVTPSGNSSAEEAENVYKDALNSILRVCVLSTSMATLTWPLYIVGRLARTAGDRTVVSHIFSQLFEKYHMRVVEGAKNAVTDRWKENLGGGVDWKNPTLLA